MTVRRFIPLLLALGLVAAPAAAGKSDERVAELEGRIETLEKQISELQGKITKIEELATRDQRAQEAYAKISQLYAQGNHMEAKTELDAFQKEFAGTEAAKQAVRIARELAVIGKPAPAQVNAAKWFAGESEANLDIAGDGTTVVVFFEEWCPHCKREVPKMEQTWEKFGPKGLNLLACTKVTKSATDDKVATFVQAHNLTFPVFKEDGQLSQYFNVSGIPAAAVVKDGKIVWRGHPANLSDQLIESLL